MRPMRPHTRLFAALLLSAVLNGGCSKSGVEPPGAFTAEFAAVLQKAEPACQVKILGALQLEVTRPGEIDFNAYLDNAYDAYRAEPGAKDDIIRRFVGADVETVTARQGEHELDVSRIVPIVKDRAWLEETGKSMQQSGAKELPDTVYEDLNAELVIIYAEDTPRTIRYLTPAALAKAHLERKNLRALACANLQRLLPKINRPGANGVYMITAGGVYESSLLLLDSVWADVQKDVQGEIVVAIPTRDLLLVTGSRDAKGIETVKQLARKASAEGSYRLTTQLFVFHDGKLEEFN